VKADQDEDANSVGMDGEFNIAFGLVAVLVMLLDDILSERVCDQRQTERVLRLRRIIDDAIAMITGRPAYGKVNLY